MAKRQKLFKCVPLKDRSVLLSILAFLLAIVFVAVAALLWYAISTTNPSDASIWFAALGTTVYAVFSIMAVITGESTWLLLGLYWGTPAA